MTHKTLDTREKLFVAEYLKDLDPKRAALAAGYAKSTAEQKSYGWVRNSKPTKPHVHAAIGKAQEERLKRTETEADWIFKRLKAELEADIADLFDKDGRLLPIHEWPLAFRTGLVQGFEARETIIGGDDDEKARVVKIRTPDRAKRYELFGKHVNVQAFSDRKEIKGIDGRVSIPEETPLSAARQMLAAIEKLKHEKETEEREA